MLNPLSSVSQASSMVLQEEHHREIQAFAAQQPELDSSSAFLSQRQQYPSNKNPPQAYTRPSCPKGFQQTSSFKNTVQSHGNVLASRGPSV